MKRFNLLRALAALSLAGSALIAKRRISPLPILSDRNPYQSR
jgi:hypothetical protein